MKALLLIFSLMLGTAHAQRSLSREAFQANVRPVLNGIVNDFYQMVSLFPGFPKEVIKVVEQMESLGEVRALLKAKCPRLLTFRCQAELDDMRSKLREAEARTLELMARERPSESPYLNSTIGMRMVGEFQNELYSFKGSLDNTSFLLRAQIKHKHEIYRVLKKMDELQTMISLTVVEYVPFTYKEDFRGFYASFIHPIEVQVAKNQNYEFLNRNVNSLNFSLNLLNMNLTKRNKKTPEGMAPFLSLMHNRWNSILRYYF